MATSSFEGALSQDRKAKALLARGLSTPTPGIASRNHQVEVYWCVKHQLLELHRSGQLVDISCVSKELIEEVHAYVMYKLAKKQRCEGTDVVQPDQLEQHITRLVQSWRQRKNQSFTRMRQRSDIPPQLRTFRQIEKAVLDEVLFSGMDDRIPITSRKPNKPSESTDDFLVKTMDVRWMPRISSFISFFSGSKSAKVSPEPV